MALDPVVNFFRSEIATLPLASGTTTMVITTGDGNKLPNPSTDGAFNLTIYNADDPFVTPEIVRCTAKSGDSLTITRAQEGTSATNKTTGSTWYVELTPTAKTIQDIDDKKLDVADVVDDLTSTDTDKALSANQGKVLQDGKLNLSGGTMTGDLTIPDKIIHSGDTNTAIRFPSADTVTVETGGSERMRVDASGNVGIGTTSPEAIFTVGSGYTNVAYNGFKTTGSPVTLFIKQSTDSIYRILGGSYGVASTTSLDISNTIGKDKDVAGAGFRVTSGIGSGESTANGYLSISSLTGNDDETYTPTELLRVLHTGNVGIGTTSPATKLDVSGSIRASTGILFGTDTAADNTLGDYEEGNWTAALRIAGNSITTETGRYTKIGNFVHLNVVFIESFTSSDGLLTITGLPFSVLTSDTDIAVGSVNWRQLGSGVSEQVSIIAQKNTTTLEFVKATSTGFQNNVNAAELLNLASGFTNYIFATITYRTT
jgi:hypothetical protein